MSSINRIKTAFVVLVSLLLPLFLYSCGGAGGGGSLLENPADNPTSVQVRVPDALQTVEPDGKTVIPIVVSVYNKNGHLLGDVTAEVSLDPDIGTLDAASKEVKTGTVTFYYTVPNYDTVESEDTDYVTINVTATNYDTGISVSTSRKIYFKVYPSKIVALIPDNSTILPADGKTTVPVTVYAFRGDGNPLTGAVIYAYASPDAGSFDSVSKQTDDTSGVVTFNYTIPSKEELLMAHSNSVTLTFKDETGKVADSVVIHFSNVSVGNGVPAAIMLKSQPSSIFTSNVPTGPKTSQIIANVVDSSGSPVSGYKVRFTLEKNPNGSYLTTNEAVVNNGYTITDFVSGAESGTALIKAEVEGVTGVYSYVPVNIEGGQASSITLLTSGTVQANDDNGTRSLEVFAFVKDSSGNPVADGTVVNFSIDDSCGGMITGSSTTKSGVAEATLTYPAVCIWKSYRITASSQSGIVATLNGGYPAVDPVKLTLAGPTTVGANGGVINISLELKDENGNGLPIYGAGVKMYSSLDNVTFNPSIVTTNIYGQGQTTAIIPANNDNNSQQRTFTITGQVGTAIGSITITQAAP